MSASKLLKNQHGDHVIIGCACGAGCACGQLQLRVDAVADESLLLVHLWFQPARRLGQRVQLAFDVLLGRAISTDLLWDEATSCDVAGWLLSLVDARSHTADS